MVRSGNMHPTHKVLTYVEYRAVSGVFRTIDSPPPLNPANVSCPPAPKAGGYTLAGRWGGGGGVNIFEDARHWIGHLQYNLSTTQPHDKIFYFSQYHAMSCSSKAGKGSGRLWTTILDKIIKQTYPLRSTNSSR